MKMKDDEFFFVATLGQLLREKTQEPTKNRDRRKLEARRHGVVRINSSTSNVENRNRNREVVLAALRNV